MMMKYIYLLHDIEGEGRDLFDGVDSNFVVKASLASLLQQVVVNLAGAEKNLLDSRGRLAGRSFVKDHSLELASWHHFIKAGLAF